MAKSILEFTKIYRELTNGVVISEEEMLIISSNIKSEVLPKKFFKKEVSSRVNFNSLQKKEENSYSTDKVDLNILKILANDASLSNVAISQKLNISRDIVRYRIKKMEECGIIVEFRPALNYSILNLNVKTVLLKLNNLDNFEEFEKYLKNDGIIIWATNTFGNYNYIIYFLTEGFEDLHNFFSEIKIEFGPIIKTYELLLAYKQYKYSFLIENLE